MGQHALTHDPSTHCLLWNGCIFMLLVAAAAAAAAADAANR